MNMLDGDNKAVRNESREDENTKKENRKNEVSSADNIKAKLRQLNEMKEEGLISDEEFAKQKERILNSF
ncbi:MAG: SHOCT domain-containing protein [Lachnospiraceae bacterium]|nr:SHOCT domain-containing protein [Lachnospiraceae bacterium]